VERGFPQLKRGTSMSLFQLVNLFHGSWSYICQYDEIQSALLCF
jgi:hypothetical protein